MSEVLRRHLHNPLLVLGSIEAVLLLFCAYVGAWISFGSFPHPATFLPSALAFTAAMILAMQATDVYGVRVREGLAGMTLRTAIGLFVVGMVSLAVIFYALPALDMGRSPLLIATGVAFVLIALVRWVAFAILSDEALKRRVLVLGSGERAMRIATRMRRGYDQRGFDLHGYVLLDGTPNLVGAQGARTWQPSVSLLDYCRQHDIEEIVAAADTHTGADTAPGRLDELLACRMAGVAVVDALTFVEREAGRMDPALLTPGWIAWSRGLAPRRLKALAKRMFDIGAGATLLFLSSPLMLMAALGVLVSTRFRGPLLAREACAGRHGRSFERWSFNLRRDGAEHRALIRRLPELLNVLGGSMSLVGPRPTPEEDAQRLWSSLPYYALRHELRPGISGWAQLNCTWESAEKDAEENLQYDLYYLKNHTILLDLAILLQACQMLVFRGG